MKNLCKRSECFIVNYLKEHGVLTAYMLFTLALALRIVDIYVLKLDERIGEILLSKLLGFLFVLWVVYLLKEGTGSIGLTTEKIKKNIIIGLVSCFLVYMVAYIFEYIFVWFDGGNPSIIVTAIDPKQGVTGSFPFMLWLLFGNIVNALMEEGLFRGLFLPRLMRKYSYMVSNLIQSILFGLWHFVWPLKNYLKGEVSLIQFIMMALAIGLPTAAMGFVWGYMFYRSKSLYLPIASHFMANSIQNILHIVSYDTFNTFIFLRGAVALVLHFALLALIRKWYQKNNNSHPPFVPHFFYM